MRDPILATDREYKKRAELPAILGEENYEWNQWFRKNIGPRLLTEFWWGRKRAVCYPFCSVLHVLGVWRPQRYGVLTVTTFWPLRRLGRVSDKAPPFDTIAPGDDPRDGLRIGKVLLLQDARGERVRVIVIQHGHGALEDDDAVIEVLIDEMDGAAGDGAAVLEGLHLRVKTGKCRQQRRMNVQDAIRVGGDEISREQAHVTGQADEIDAVLAEAGDDVGVVFSAWAAAGDEALGGQAQLARGGYARSADDVGEDDGNLDARKAALGDGAGDGQKVRSTSGEQDAEARFFRDVWRWPACRRAHR